MARPIFIFVNLVQEKYLRTISEKLPSKIIEGSGLELRVINGYIESFCRPFVVRKDVALYINGQGF